MLVVGLILGNSYFTAGAVSRLATEGGRSVSAKLQIEQYAASIVLQFFMLFLVWVGLRLKRTRLREVIGGRWATVEDFLLDVAIAAAFWLLSLAVLYGLARLLGLASPAQIQETKKLAMVLAPQNSVALAFFACLSAVAGFVEEVIFRGYLQRQLGVLTGNMYAGLIASALVFGAGHGYEGTRRMVLIFVYGLLFGLLALWRKSLRPGMMAHAWHDAIEGVVLFVVRKGLIPMR
ncbi:MAG TPA: CPBP family intramembrane glutamic endopeptidase [Candidatus Angelobacter sp.]